MTYRRILFFIPLLVVKSLMRVYVLVDGFLDRMPICRSYPTITKKLIWILCLILLYCLVTHKENTPTAVVRRFCDALVTGKYSKAFNELAIDEYRELQNEPRFSTLERVGLRILFCKAISSYDGIISKSKNYHVEDQSEKNLLHRLMGVYGFDWSCVRVAIDMENGYGFNLNVWVIRLSHGKWKICPDHELLSELSSPQRINTPKAVVRRFCNAIAEGCYEAAASELLQASSADQREREIKSRAYKIVIANSIDRDRGKCLACAKIGDAKPCLSNATDVIVEVSIPETSRQANVKIAQNSEGDWKIATKWDWILKLTAQTCEPEQQQAGVDNGDPDAEGAKSDENWVFHILKTIGSIFAMIFVVLEIVRMISEHRRPKEKEEE